MSFAQRTVLTIAAFAVVTLTSAASLRADIVGFGDFSQFQINKADAAAAPTLYLNLNKIKLINLANDESRSIFHTSQHSITQFTASFTYQALGTPTGNFGATFVLQSDPRGVLADAVPNISGIPTKFGYSDFFGGIRPSVAISLEHGSLGAGSSSTAAYTNGSVGGGSNPTNPLNIFSGNPIQVSLDYNGTILHERLFDPLTNALFEVSYPLDIPAIIGGSTAFVGLTAASGPGTVEQYFSDLRFSTVPEPSSLMLFASAATATLLYAVRRRRRQA